MRLRKLSTLLYAAPVVGLLIFVALRIAAFVHIFGTHAGILLTQAEIAASAPPSTSSSNSSSSSPPQQIPKIIHQIFHNWKNPGHDAELPPDWAAARQTCIDLHPGWDVKLWAEAESRAFIAREYPTFLATYDGYRFPVQRTDALRYYLLLHYGGIYLDLDNGCLANLEPLLYYPTFVADGAMGALSNNILAARPHHPFWNYLTLSLSQYDYNYILPYITISYASGQWFETDVWERYHAQLPEANDKEFDGRLYRLSLDGREAHTWVFFTNGRGGTWNNWDNRVFGWIGQHLVVVILGGAVAGSIVVWGLVRCVRCVRRRRGGYHRLNGDEGDAEKYNERV